MPVLHRHPGDERGIIFIEVLVAVVLLVIGLLSTFVVLNSSSHMNGTTVRQSVRMSQGEQAIEQMKTYRYQDLGLSSIPTATVDPGGSNPSNPNYWVSDGDLRIVTNYGDVSSPNLPGIPSAGAVEPLESGAIDPQPPPFSIGGATVSIYRYVTWVNLQCGDPDSCTGPQDAKRLTVAVVLNSANGVGANKPVWLSTVVGAPPAPTS